MELKKQKIKSRFLKTAKEAFKKRTFLILSLIVYSIALFLSGYILHKTGFLNKIKGKAQHLLSPHKYLASFTSKIDQININLKHKDLQRLSYWRELALKQGTLRGVDHDFVNADFVFENEVLPARIRLRGSTAREHLEGKRWSLRVKIKDRNTFMGMKEFSLMDPKRRNFLLEWLFRKIMEKEGLISKKYFFLQVSINGLFKGVYAVDEHFGKTMIEANKRRNGPIVRLETDPLWFEKAAYTLSPYQWDDYYFSAQLDTIDTKKVIQDEVLLEQFVKAKDLVEGFKQNYLTASQVFDVDKMSKFMAATAVMAGWHGLIGFNMNFYYNPISSKLEPIADDTYTETRLSFGIEDKYIIDAFTKQLLDDPVFAEKYLTELQRFSKKDYLDQIFNDLKDSISNNLRIINRQHPGYRLPKEVLYKNQKDIREMLQPAKGVAAYFKEENPIGLVLSLAALKTLPIEILNLTDGKVIIKTKEDKVILNGKGYAKPLVFADVSFDLPSGFDIKPVINRFKVSYRVLGTSNRLEQMVSSLPAYEAKITAKKPGKEYNQIGKLKFLSINSLSKKITVKPGNWVLTKDLVIPEGYLFSCAAGVSIDLKKSAMIIAHSPIDLTGLASNPVRIFSSDKTGQGVFVLNAGEKSRIKNVIFKNLKAANRPGLRLTGAVTFYESPVSITQTTFSDSMSEDSLNIISSNFKLKNVLFENSYADALDLDFCQGLLENVTFKNSGNDAVDFSGSIVNLSNCYISNAKDKGVSVGESSDITINGLIIDGAKLAVVSKDNSQLKIKAVNINDCEIAFAVYQKKPEFGPSGLIASSVVIKNTKHDYLLEKKSRLVINGEKINQELENVYQKLYF